MGNQKKERARLNRAERAARRQGTLVKAASPTMTTNSEAQLPTSISSIQADGSLAPIESSEVEHAPVPQKKRQVTKAKATRARPVAAVPIQKITSSRGKEKAPTPQSTAASINTIGEEQSAIESRLVDSLSAILDNFSESEYEEVDESHVAALDNQESNTEKNDSSNELEEPGPAGNRTRNTNVSSTSPYEDHRRQIASAMGYTSEKQIASLDLAWKLNTAKKSDLPAEFGTDRDLKKLTIAYRSVVDKEAGKAEAWKKKLAKGKVKPGTKPPVELDIVVIITNVSTETKPKKTTNTDVRDNDTAPSVPTDQPKPDTSFIKRARAKYPCALDPKAVCVINPLGEHVHAAPVDLNLWDVLEKQDPLKYGLDLGEIPRELRLYDASRKGRRLPNPTAPTASDSSPMNAVTSGTTATQGAMLMPQSANAPLMTSFPNIALPPVMHPAMHPAYLGLLSAHAMYPPGFPPAPYMNSFDIPPSPAKPVIKIDHPLITDWLRDLVDSDESRVRDGQSYANFGSLLTQAGFFRINELVDNKYVTVESLQGLGIELGFASNLLRWATDDVHKANRDVLRARRGGL